MANPLAILTGDPLALDMIVAADGTVGMKAAGDPQVVAGAADTSNSQLVQIHKSDTGTHAIVASSASSVTLQAANTLRKGWTIWNDSAAILYVKLDASAASVTACTVKLIADAFWVMPLNYTGEIRGIWASATGNARMVEFT